MWKARMVSLVPSPAIWLQGLPELLLETVFGALKGAVDGGLSIPHSQTIPWL